MKSALVAICVLLLLSSATSALTITNTSMGECLVKAYVADGGASDTIFLPGTKEYNDTLFIDNARVVVFPAAAVRPAGEEDIVHAMTASQQCGCRFTVISGGHSAQGYGLAEGGLTVNMRSMNTTTIIEEDDGKKYAIVESGSRFSELYGTLADRNKGEMVVGGGCPQVAIAGFTLGGGWSFLSRSYGLGIDNLVEVRLILPNKTITSVNAQHADKELWWALRGGGGGNFGVATSFKTKVHHPEQKSSIGQICWPEFSVASKNFMVWWIATFDKMPNFLLFDPSWLPLGPDRARMFCFTVICNAKKEDCDPWLEILRNGKIAPPPTLDTVTLQPYVDFAKNNVNITTAQEGYLYLKSFVFNREHFTIDTIDQLIAALRVAPSSRNLVLFHVGGGAIADVPANATAFPHRNCTVLLQIKAIWDTPEEQAENFKWIDETAKVIFANVTGAYVNYIDADLNNWQTAYYGKEGYQRLLAVKNRVDPENFFNFKQSIGSP